MASSPCLPAATHLRLHGGEGRSADFGAPVAHLWGPLTRSFTTWEAWHRHTLRLPVPALRPLIAATEYDAWTHGPVVYEQAPARFVIYADRQRLIPHRAPRRAQSQAQ